MTKATSTVVDSPSEPESGREHYPIRVADAAAVAAFWTLIALISAASRQLDPRIPGLPRTLVAAVQQATFVEYLLWGLLTLPILWATSRYSIEGGKRWGRVALFVLLGIVIAVFMDALLLRVREFLIAPLGRFRRRPPPAGLFGGLGFLDDLMVYFAVLGAGIARDYFLRYRARVVETMRLQTQLTQARLDVLRSQLNPHFLFNTLNAISALAERDPRGVRRMIARLSDLLRYTLEEGTDQEVSLSRELDLLGEYVDLMQIRFQGKLDVTMDIDDDTRGAMVPNLLLQPIVENAIKHGVSRITGVGKIRVRSRRMDGALVITVTDNGPGPGAGPPGVGLRNTNARLGQMYGAEYHVTLRAAAGDGGRGTDAEIVLPFHTAPVVARDDT